MPKDVPRRRASLEQRQGRRGEEARVLGLALAFRERAPDLLPEHHLQLRQGLALAVDVAGERTEALRGILHVPLGEAEPGEVDAGDVRGVLGVRLGLPDVLLAPSGDDGVDDLRLRPERGDATGQRPVVDARGLHHAAHIGEIGSLPDLGEVSVDRVLGLGGTFLMTAIGIGSPFWLGGEKRPIIASSLATSTARQYFFMYRPFHSSPGSADPLLPSAPNHAG